MKEKILDNAELENKIKILHWHDVREKLPTESGVYMVIARKDLLLSSELSSYLCKYSLIEGWYVLPTETVLCWAEDRSKLW